MTVRWQPMPRRRRVPEPVKDILTVIAFGGGVLFLTFVRGWLKTRGWW